ncbi:MAG: hypothetical protein ACW98F_04735 [Candidatus Hodarchaeales archaeon]
MSCTNTMSRTDFQNTTVTAQNIKEANSALGSRILAALYSHMQEKTSED